jgi:hypothetical protein
MATAVQLNLDDRSEQADTLLLIGLKLSVPCTTWGEKALEVFGEGFSNRNVTGTIHKVIGKVVRSLSFSVEFPELNMVYDNYRWEYVLKYMTSDLPFKYHKILAHFAKPVPKNGGTKRPTMDSDTEMNTKMPSNTPKQPRRKQPPKTKMADIPQAAALAMVDDVGIDLFREAIAQVTNQIIMDERRLICKVDLQGLWSFLAS